jgi:hypothetical protein
MSEVETPLDAASAESAGSTAAPVAAAPSSAMGLLRQTAEKSKSILQQAGPVTQQVLTSAVYNGSYYLAFGVTFPTLFAVHLIPGGRRMVSGIVDGAIAANDYLEKLETAKSGRSAVTAAAASESSATATA